MSVRFRWSQDGTVKKWLDPRYNTLTAFAAVDDKLDADQWDATDRINYDSAYARITLIFPAPRTISAIGFRSTQPQNAAEAQYSTDTTDGIDGTWYPLVLSGGIAQTNTYIKLTCTPTSCVGFRFWHSGGWAESICHLYGDFTAPQFNLCDTSGNVLDADYPFIFSGFGNNQDRSGTTSFKIKNNSGANHTYQLNLQQVKYTNWDKETDQHVGFALGTTARYWRFKPTKDQDGGSAGALVEFALLDATGNPLVPSSATSGQGVAANAYDGNTSTYWAYDGGTPSAAWLRYDLGSPQTPVGIRITCGSNTNVAARAWTLEYSTDDIVWTTIDTRTVSITTFTEAYQTRTFHGRSGLTTSTVNSGGGLSEAIILSASMPKGSNPGDGIHSFGIKVTEI